MFRKPILLVASLALLLAACASPATPTANKLKVVATFSILGDLAQNVGGDRIEIHTLVGPGLDTHTFEPGPADSTALADAALIFENGLEFEPWLDDLYSASGSSAERVMVSNGLEPLESGEHGEEPGESDHGEFDPHLWHSADNAVHMVKVIRDALARADAPNAAYYQANAEAYTAQLQGLDDWIFAQVKALPESRRRLVTTHDTFAYFADRYGFEIIGAVLPVSTEGVTPSAQELAALVDSVKAAGVPAVFAENVSSNTLLRQVADEAGVGVVASLYTDALGPPGSDGDTYLKMMRYNVATIVAELGK
jgi:ABC-type Zn uptake system ZnuABC Zn-binding protein ZnuA